MSATGSSTTSNIPRGLILLAVSLCTMLYAITLTMVNVVLPQMQGALSATPDQISWVVTLNVIATAVATPMTGWMVARWGYRNVLLWSIIGFSIASVLCALADTLVPLLIYRVGQGAFGAPLVPLAQAIIVAVYPPERRAFAQGIFGIAVVIGPANRPGARWLFIRGLQLADGVSAYSPALCRDLYRCMAVGARHERTSSNKPELDRFPRTFDCGHVRPIDDGSRRTPRLVGFI